MQSTKERHRHIKDSIFGANRLLCRPLHLVPLLTVILHSAIVFHFSKYSTTYHLEFRGEVRCNNTTPDYLGRNGIILVGERLADRAKVELYERGPLWDRLINSTRTDNLGYYSIGHSVRRLSSIPMKWGDDSFYLHVEHDCPSTGPGWSIGGEEWYPAKYTHLQRTVKSFGWLTTEKMHSYNSYYGAITLDPGSQWIKDHMYRP